MRLFGLCTPATAPAVLILRLTRAVGETNEAHVLELNWLNVTAVARIYWMSLVG